MPDKIQAIIDFLAKAEAPKEQTARIDSASDLLSFLTEISGHLSNLQGIFAESFQVQCLSLGSINNARVFASVGQLKAQLWALAKPYTDNNSFGIPKIIERIKDLYPSIGQENRYIYQAAKLALWNGIINQRTHIPQSFVGIVDAKALEDIPTYSTREPTVSISSAQSGPAVPLRKFTFLATHGIGPCVGFLLYSRQAARCALAHFDDAFNITRPMSKKEKESESYSKEVAHAQVYYHASLTGILQQARVGISADCDDWKIILTPSTMLESTNLAKILTELCTPILGEANIITSSFNEADRSILINLQNCDFEVLLTYEESVELSAFPQESLTLRQALNFPPIGGQLYRIARGLIKCDLDKKCYKDGSYITTQDTRIANEYIATATATPLDLENVAKLEKAVDDAVKASLTASSTTLEESGTFSAAATSSGLFISAAGARVASAGDSAAEQHPFDTAAQYCDRIEHLQDIARLSTSVITNLTTAQLDPQHVTYSTAVAASALVALTAASTEFSSVIPASAPIESSNIHPIAIAALAALAAAEKIDFKPSKGSVPRRGALGGRGTAAGRLGFQDRRGGGVRGVQTGHPPESAAASAIKRPLAPSYEAPASKFPRMSAIMASDKQTPITDVATTRSSLENPTAVTTHTNSAPVVRPVFIPPYITTFIAATLANVTIAKFMEATVAGEAEISAISKATLALINALAAVARTKTTPSTTSALASSLEPTAAASASAAIPQDHPVNSAIQTIIGIPLPASSDAGLIDRLTVHLAKTAAATLRGAQLAIPPTAGAAVARPFSFLRTQAEAAAAHHSPSAADSVTPAPRDDPKIKADDDNDSTKPKQ